MYTSYYILKYNLGGIDLGGFTESYYPTDNHHKYIFSHLNDTVNKISDSRTFVYVHLLMPHAPLMFNPEFPFRKINNLKNYEAFWRFTNQKLEKVLTNLSKENKYKIILTGDHGLRGDSKIDFHNTFSAFYGFDHSAIDHVKSVQDLGSLINASF